MYASPLHCQNRSLKEAGEAPREAALASLSSPTHQTPEITMTTPARLRRSSLRLRSWRISDNHHPLPRIPSLGDRILAQPGPVAGNKWSPKIPP